MTGVRLAIPLIALITTLAGCAAPAPQSHADAARQAACRDHADEVYLHRNRAELFAADQYASSTRDAPFGGSVAAATPATGLSGQYDRDTLLENCLNATGGGAAGSSPTQPVTPPQP